MPYSYGKKLSCVIALAAVSVGCGSQGNMYEELPPPAASVGDEPVMESQAPLALEEPPTPDMPPPAAQLPEPPKPTMPTVGAVVTHRVKDYDAWKTAFDADEGARAAAGVVGHGLSVDADRKNTVVVYIGSTDLVQLQDFLGSKDLKKAMKEAGVRGKPQITYMRHTESQPAEGQAVITAMITHEVKDYGAWKTAFDAHADARTAAGVIGASISQDPENPNLLHVYLEGSDAEKLRAFSKDKELKKAMKEAGVKGRAKFTFMTPKEMKLYPPQPATPEPETPATPAAADAPPTAGDVPPAPSESPAPAPAAP